MAAVSYFAYTLVIQAKAKISVLKDSVVAIRPVAQFLVGYRFEEGWYVFLAHVKLSGFDQIVRDKHLNSFYEKGGSYWRRKLYRISSTNPLPENLPNIVCLEY